MSQDNRISLRRVSEFYQIEFEVVLEWAEFGLYPLLPGGQDLGIEPQTLTTLKKIVGLHRALGVNKEGIEVILSLNRRIASLEAETQALKAEVVRRKAGWGTEPAEDLRRQGLFIEID